MTTNAHYHPGNIFSVARIPMRDDKDNPITCQLDGQGRWYVIHAGIRRDTVDIWSTCSYLNMTRATPEV